MDTNYFDNRLPPSSSELVALSTLSPPSPVLSCSELSTSITSGDIPILLDGLDYSLLQTFPSTSTLKSQRISANESIYDVHLSQSDSTVSIGTFGPVRKSPNFAYAEHNSESLATEHPFQWPTGTFLRLESSASHWNTEKQESATGWRNVNIDNYSRFTAGSHGQPQERVIDDKRTGSQKATLTCQAIVQPLSSEFITNNPRLQPLGLEVESPPSKQHEIRASVDHCSKKSITEANSKAFILSRAEGLSYSWLDDVKVLLSIDQEGFRSINPSFRFIGCIPQIVCEKQQRRENVAQFVPVNKQVFHFHYAPFDGLPVLRRIYVNGDENYDYISREATLALRSNGLYAICGVELASHSVDDDNRAKHDATDLYWEFMYKVDDRRVGPSRKLIDGEKDFTPLSFSCSPGLLQPGQGKKVNLIHVVKKSITARLTAEKLNASEPNPKAFYTARLHCHDAANVDSNLHRRALSYGLQKGLQSTSTARPFLQGKVQEEERNNAYKHGSQSSHRRRASSAGEWKGRDRQPRHGLPGHKLMTSPPIQKHIVNPARLAQMLDESHTEPKVIQAPQSGFPTLAPDSRHFHKNNIF